MNYKEAISNNLSQIYAITEKEINLRLRFKLNLVLSYITPIISIFMPIVIMGQFFTYISNFGDWSEKTIIVYQFIAYSITILRTIIFSFAKKFKQEKYWYTLQALIIAPFNRFNLLLGIFIGQLFFIMIPFLIFILLESEPVTNP